MSGGQRHLKERAAAVLAAVMLAGTAAPAQIAWALPETGENSYEMAAHQGAYISFPSRFGDYMEQGEGEKYYVFSLDSKSDVTITVEFEDDAAAVGAELLDGMQNRISVSGKKHGQRITKNDLEAGTYFLRIYSLNEDFPEGEYQISLQRLKLKPTSGTKVDFSELHMVATAYDEDSPLFLNCGDVNYAWDAEKEGFVKLATPDYANIGIQSGGVLQMAANYYRNWFGPIDESEMKLADVRNILPGETENEYGKYLYENVRYFDGGNPEIHVQNMIMLPTRFGGWFEYENEGWMEHCKNAIMTYGAVTTSIRWVFSCPCENPDSYYYNGWAWRQNGRDYEAVCEWDEGIQGTNHDVAIVGWDDNYDRENFRYKSHDNLVEGSENLADDKFLPEGDGAWIIRNSWGTNYGEKGYYYVSYYDKRLGGVNNNGVFSATESNDNYNKLYSSFPLLDLYLLESPNGSVISNVYTADENSVDLLKAVSFNLIDTDVDYEIGVNIGAENIGKLLDETNTYGAGSKKYRGFYTVRLDKPLVLKPGEPFQILLRLSSRTEDVVTISTIENGPYGDSLPPAEGISFIYSDEQDGWEDVGKEGIKYAQFNLQALCEDTTLEEGTVQRIYAIADPDMKAHYLAIGETETHTATVKTQEQEDEEPGQATPSEAQRGKEVSKKATEAEAQRGREVSKKATEAEAQRGREVSKKATEAEAQRKERLVRATETEAAEKEIKATPSEAGTRQRSRLEKQVVLRESTLALPDQEPSKDPEPVQAELPEAFDLRDVGALTLIKNQRHLAICWTMATTAALESNYLLNGNNLYDYNYSSGIRMESELPMAVDGSLIYEFDEADVESLDNGIFWGTLLSWDNGPMEDNDGAVLHWEFTGDTSAVDFGIFDEYTEGSRRTETGEVVQLFTPKENGVLNVKVSSIDDPTKVASCKVVLIEKGLVDSITLNAERLTLSRGDTYDLKAEIITPDGETVKPIFTSDNEGAAVVDENGTIVALAAGTTVIRVRAGDKEALCRVTVRGSGSDRDSEVITRNKAESNKAKGVQGTWTLNQDGSWSFTANGQEYQNTWGYLYNPYENNGQGDSGWFRFDEGKRLVTGWFEDTEGSRYYLNPESDGAKGKMLVGWCWIPDETGWEHCYYFRTEAGGPMGSLLRNGVTPDGYEVDDQGRCLENGQPVRRRVTLE